MVKFYTKNKPHSEHTFDSLIRFDGRSVEGNNFFTHLPISPKDYREERGDFPVFIQFWKGETVTEFVVTDDWGEQHVLLIPNKMSEVIEQSKANIISSDIPSNLTK